MTDYRIERQCRSCHALGVTTILDLGNTPLADRLVRRQELSQEDIRAPLTLAFCSRCALVQILETVEPEILFGADYPYYSSVSESLLAHFRDSAAQIIERESLNRNCLVIEAASNDGYMLRNFAHFGIPVLGIDPAPGPAGIAVKQGIPTRQYFFGLEVAESLRSEYEEGADVFLANNVLAHVADLNGFVKGIRVLLKETGTAVIEVPYVVDLVNRCEFDTIYHQHLCYFSVTSLNRLFRNHGLFLNDVERTWVHGGSLRLHVHQFERPREGVIELLEGEDRQGIDSLDYYAAFADRTRKLAKRLKKMLEDLKRSGHSIAGYGAAAKAATMLSLAGIDRSILDFIADRNEHKHGWYMGGNHIPIVGTEEIVVAQPDYLLLLAWNFADEIISAQTEYAGRGGKFIVPVPEPEIRGI